MPEPKLALLDELASADLEALVEGVRQHNFAQMGEERAKPLAALARDESGQLLGGVAGRTIYWQFLIEVLWVAESHRGRGLARRLMALAEAQARRRGCLAAQVDTLAFQAPDFYQKLGFAIVGKVDGVAQSPDRYFLLKHYR